MMPTPEQAWELLCEYNEGDFHRKHGRIVGDACVRCCRLKTGETADKTADEARIIGQDDGISNSYNSDVDTRE